MDEHQLALIPATTHVLIFKLPDGRYIEIPADSVVDFIATPAAISDDRRGAYGVLSYNTGAQGVAAIRKVQFFAADNEWFTWPWEHLEEQKGAVADAPSVEDLDRLWE